MAVAVAEGEKLLEVRSKERFKKYGASTT